MKRMSDIPESERPREKMRRGGAQSLSDSELLAILLGRGTQEMDVFAMADRILEVFGKAKECPPLEELEKIKGVGPARATLISAAIEFARRRIRPEGFKVTFPTDVMPIIQHYADRKQEHFLCVSLNGANEVIKTRVVSVGTVDRTQVYPRDVFADPVADRAAAVIIAHNHPAASVEPSKEDIALTKQLVDAGKTLGIRVLDHIIFNQKTHYSMKEHNTI